MLEKCTHWHPLLSLPCPLTSAVHLDVEVVIVTVTGRSMSTIRDIEWIVSGVQCEIPLVQSTKKSFGASTCQRQEYRLLCQHWHDFIHSQCISGTVFLAYLYPVLWSEFPSAAGAQQVPPLEKYYALVSSKMNPAVVFGDDTGM